jgi:hypothetical protein
MSNMPLQCGIISEKSGAKHTAALFTPWIHRGGAEVQLHSLLTAVHGRRLAKYTPRPLYPRVNKTLVPIEQRAEWV